MSDKILSEILAKLENLQVGECFSGVDLDFTIFYNYEKTLVELESRRITRPLEIEVLKRGEKMTAYKLTSGGKEAIVMSEKAWNLDGGFVNPDNLAGNFFLQLPLLSSTSELEARLYLGRRSEER